MIFTNKLDIVNNYDFDFNRDSSFRCVYISVTVSQLFDLLICTIKELDSTNCRAQTTVKIPRNPNIH